VEFLPCGARVHLRSSPNGLVALGSKTQCQKHSTVKQLIEVFLQRPGVFYDMCLLPSAPYHGPPLSGLQVTALRHAGRQANLAFISSPRLAWPPHKPAVSFLEVFSLAQIFPNYMSPSGQSESFRLRRERSELPLPPPSVVSSRQLVA